ncbi:universal stress protein [Actinoplanes sp. NPDC020271]|uniref:universal stress protein n=1 Tax=Actinoplanes sp. NPDC020271 TaxID=3363896 RepID=UPI0037A21515
MPIHAGAPVVVGADGSASAMRAVEYAATEAALRHRPLLILHAYAWPPAGVAYSTALAATADATLRRAADDILQDAAWHAARTAPAITCSTRAVTGDPATVLLELSEQANVLVLGARGSGGFAEMMVGSVAAHVTPHAACPVAVVRGSVTSGPVVAGVDGSPGSAAALDFAADEADRRGTELVAVHAWTTAGGTGLDDGLPAGRRSGGSAEEHHRVLAEALAGIAERHPDLTVHGEVRHGLARQVLTARSDHAQLIVVGSRGHGGVTGLMMGSVSQHLIYRAACPVAVVRAVPVAAA